MSVSQMTMTDAGKQLLARALVGTELNFTRIAVGDGTLTSQGQIAGLTGLIHQVVSVPITTRQRKGSVVTLRGELAMSADAASFRWREQGVFAQIGNEAEVLYAYINFYEDGEIVKPADGAERTITVSVAVGDASNVTVTLVPLENVDWSRIENAPETYPPSAHSHEWSELAAIAADLSELADADLIPVADASDAEQPKRTTWAAVKTAIKTYLTEIFAAATHNHDASDITGGTLPVSRGGTGRSTMTSGYFLRGNGTSAVILSSATSARQAMSAVTPVGPITVTLYAASWSGSGPWTQQVSVSGVTANDNHLHVYPVDVTDADARKLYEAAYGCLAAQADTLAGAIKFTCRDKKPETNFQVIIEGGRV